MGTFQQDDAFPYKLSPRNKFLFIRQCLPFFPSCTVSYVRRLSQTSKMADWKIKVNKRCFVCKKIRNVNRGLTDKRHAEFDLLVYLRDYVMNHTSSFSNSENFPLI